MKRLLVGAIVTSVLILAGAATPSGASDEPQFTADGKLLAPAGYRQWPLIGTGLGMAYGPQRQTPDGRPLFTSVFVNPAAYRAFLQSGAWPDGTLFILENRESMSVNNSATGGNGYFQGEITGIEAEVKDARRFPGKWGFFNLGKAAEGKLIPTTASCYSCHAANGAVDNTFVQFYPVLRDVAREKGTLRAVPEQF